MQNSHKIITILHPFKTLKCIYGKYRIYIPKFQWIKICQYSDNSLMIKYLLVKGFSCFNNQKINNFLYQKIFLT